MTPQKLRKHNRTASKSELPTQMTSHTPVTPKEHIETIQREIQNELFKYNLHVNPNKTETYTIPKPKPPKLPPPFLETLYEQKHNKLLWSDLDWIINFEIKTEKDETPDWKHCKLLGSLLDTEN